MSFILTNHYGIIDYVKKFNAKKELSIYGAHLESKINSILKNIPDVTTQKLEELSSSSFYIFKFGDMQERPKDFNDNALKDFSNLIKKGCDVVFIMKREKSLQAITELNKEIIYLRSKIENKKANERQKQLINQLESKELISVLPSRLDIHIYDKEFLSKKPIQITANYSNKSSKGTPMDALQVLKKKLSRFRGEICYFAIDNKKINTDYLAAYFNNPLGEHTIYKYQIEQYPDNEIKNIKNASIHLTSTENQKTIASIDDLLLKIKKNLIKLQDESKFNPASKQIEEKFYSILKEIKELTPAEKVLRIIQNDEARNAEFKASFELQTEDNKKEGKKKGEKNIRLRDRVIETINAFMIKDGGVLLIGVQNGGEILGINDELKKWHFDKKLKRPSQDKFKMHFHNILGTRLDSDYIDFISSEFIDIGSKTIFYITIKPSKNLIYVDGENLFERRSASTHLLKGKRLETVISNFNKKK